MNDLLAPPAENDSGVQPMSFVLDCPFCHLPGVVPEYAYNCGLRCRTCSGRFMLVPKALRARLLRDEPFRSKNGRATVRSKLVTSFAPAVETKLEPNEILSQPKPLPEVPKPAPAPSAAWDEEDEGSIAGRAAGLVALLLGASSLVCGSISGVAFLVLPLGLLGLVLGGLGLVRSWRREEFSWVAAGGVAACTAVLGLVWLAPDLLGPNYQAYRQRNDVEAIRVVALPGQIEAEDIKDPNWVDASRAGLRQGNLHLHVTGVELASGTSKVFRKAPKDAKKQYLILRLRVLRSGSGREYASDNWGLMGWGKEMPHLKLADSAGKVYEQLQDLDLALGSSSEARQDALFPVAVANPSFIFEAPTTDFEHLRLEVPTTSWGGAGAFRFTIPKRLIREPAPG